MTPIPVEMLLLLSLLLLLLVLGLSHLIFCPENSEPCEVPPGQTSEVTSTVVYLPNGGGRAGEPKNKKK